MELNLSLLSTDYLRVGKPTDFDLFNAHGQLLLAKGKVVTPPIMELLLNRDLYILHYELKRDEHPVKSFSPDLYREIIGSMERIYYDARLVSSENLLETMDIVDNIIHELKGNRSYVDFNRFRTYDNYTYVHSINVSILATLIAVRMGYSGTYLHNICLGALLHDLGKLMIPVSILQKPSGLSLEEFEIIKRHPIEGQSMLRNVCVPEEVLLSTRQHHERWNGQGYPDGLLKENIHPSAQIVAVVDVFDALTADRPYRKGLPPYHALEMIIAGSGTEFAPDVVQAFRGSLVLYPKNSLVTLNTGKVGVVIAVPDNNPTRPLVHILFDEWGNFDKDGKVVDLLEDLTLFINEVKFNEG